MTSAVPRPSGQLSEDEQREIIDRLTGFSHFSPPWFSGQSLESWEAETWVAAMEKLVENFFVPERYQVHLATHFLETDTEIWWRRVCPVGPPGAQNLSWIEFRALLFGAFFPDSVKQKFGEDLRNLRQGDRSLQEYIIEFTRLLNCVSFVARDEAHRVY